MSFLRNSTPVVDGVTPRHLLTLEAGRVTGVLILSVLMEDSGTVYRCVARSNGQEIVSGNSTLIVGGK